ncbi:MAG: class I SAM-dependent methyltransferase [Gammaproteobacteria bacterium]|jgi:16S rRNA (guanine1516-N2)-methyltransferase
MNSPSICIVCANSSCRQQALELARKTGLPLLEKQSSDFDLQLCFEQDRVELFDTHLKTAIHVDFAHGTLAHRQQFGGGRGQAIARAIGLRKDKTPDVLDITAGLARDAYILAVLGCKVTLVEQSPVLYSLIEDGIKRGLVESASAGVLKNFISLVNADAVQYMKNMDSDSCPDVIYIDPMYPEKKKSALVKKDMQILQRLLGKDEQADQLLKTALRHSGKRVVVKRPIHAEPVGDIKPDTSISSKKTRYDIYLVRTH